MRTEFTELTKLRTLKSNSGNSVNSVKNSGRQTASEIIDRKSKIVNEAWLPDMDLNHDKQIQSLLCYRYTIGQAGAVSSVSLSIRESSRQTSVPIIDRKS
jgi:hypothetical protein